MTLIEQAVFTSAETDRLAGYQVVAKSPGVGEGDCRELAVWCPSHDSLLDAGAEALSLNFHPLPSGAYCLSRTTPAGWEYSGRGGLRVYTHCLIVPSAVLTRFSNNPFALARAAEATGAMEVAAKTPQRLGPLSLVGSAAAVDQTLLAHLAHQLGPQQMAALVQAALHAVCLAVAGPASAAQWMAGLFACLPPQCRTEFSFSTGLKFSSRRPFRLVTLPADPAQRRWLAHQTNVTALDLNEGAPAATMPIEGWAELIGRVLSSGRISFLSMQLSKRDLELTLADLPAWGLQLLEDLEASVAHEKQDAATADRRPAGQAICEKQQAPATTSTGQRADAAHCRFQKGGQSDTVEQGKAAAAGTAAANRNLAQPAKKKPKPPAASPDQTVPPNPNDNPLPDSERTVDPTSPTVLELLEYLDDVVYGAINGTATALEELETLWPAALAELGEELLAESRQQYLRYALMIWDDCVEPEAIRDASRAVQALDVLCVLFNQI